MCKSQKPWLIVSKKVLIHYLVFFSRAFEVPKARDFFHAKIFLGISPNYQCETFALAAQTGGALYVGPVWAWLPSRTFRPLATFFTCCEIDGFSSAWIRCFGHDQRSGLSLANAGSYAYSSGYLSSKFRSSAPRFASHSSTKYPYLYRLCYAEFFGPCMLADEAISTLRELALLCPQGCPLPAHVNWVDGGKVVSLDSIWSRLSKLGVQRHRLHYRKTPKKFWDFSSASICPCHIRELHIPKPIQFKSGLELERIDSGILELFLEHGE